MSSEIDQNNIFEQVLESELGLLRPDLSDDTYDQAPEDEAAIPKRAASFYRKAVEKLQ